MSHFSTGNAPFLQKNSTEHDESHIQNLTFDSSIADPYFVESESRNDAEVRIK